MATKEDYSSWSEVRDKFRIWREDKERRSRDVIDLWESVLKKKVHKLGDEKYLVYEQVFVAALDSNRFDLAKECRVALNNEFPESHRVRKLLAMEYEATERYDKALDVLESIIKRDETNAAPRKRKVAILKAKGKISEAIKELVEYLKNFMSDQEAWQELCDLYLLEQDYAHASFCMEELILHNPHNHLIHQRYAEIRYTQGGFENYEIARAHFSQAVKLNPNNMRALYGVFLASTNIAVSPKCPSTKKKDASKVAKWALKQIRDRYQQRTENTSYVDALESISSPPAITTT